MLYLSKTKTLCLLFLTYRNMQKNISYLPVENLVDSVTHFRFISFKFLSDNDVRKQQRLEKRELEERLGHFRYHKTINYWRLVSFCRQAEANHCKARGTWLSYDHGSPFSSKALTSIYGGSTWNLVQKRKERVQTEKLSVCTTIVADEHSRDLVFVEHAWSKVEWTKLYESVRLQDFAFLIIRFSSTTMDIVNGFRPICC